MEALASALGFAGAMVVTVAGLVLLAGVIFVWALRNMQKPSRDESEADLIVGDFPNVPAKYPERGR